MNQQVKKAIRLWEQSHRLDGKCPNWTLILGSVELGLNAKEQKGKYGVSSFETVFGFKHRENDGVESFDKMRKCCTVAKHMAMSSKHSEFYKMMKSNKDWVYMDTKDIPEEKDDRPLWPNGDKTLGDIDFTKESEEDLGGFPPGGFKESPKPVEDKTVLNKNRISVEDMWQSGYKVIDVRMTKTTLRSGSMGI